MHFSPFVSPEAHAELTNKLRNTVRSEGTTFALLSTSDMPVLKEEISSDYIVIELYQDGSACISLAESLESAEALRDDLIENQ